MIAFLILAAVALAAGALVVGSRNPVLSALWLALNLAAALVVPTAEPSPPADPPAEAPATASPLLGTMGRNGASSAPRIRLSKRAIRAARRKTTRSNTCC